MSPHTKCSAVFSVRAFGVGVLCALSIAGPVHAAHPYERTAEQLTATTLTYRNLVQEMRGYDVFFHRDPMQPLIDARGQLVSAIGLHDGLAVQGIIWSDQKPLVIIEDELFTQGAQVGPYTILQVHTDGVIVQRENECLFIPLDRGIETPKAHPVSFLTLFQDISAPYAPRRTIIVLDSPTLTQE